MEQTSQENARAGHFTLFDDANPPSVKSADIRTRVIYQALKSSKALMNFYRWESFDHRWHDQSSISVPDSSATLPADRHAPSSTGMTLNNHYQITDADLAALFLSPTAVDREHETGCMETFDTALLSQINELVDAPEREPVGPPPGFEHLHFDATASDTSATLSLISDLTLQSHVSPSDQICSSQLLNAGRTTYRCPSLFLRCRAHSRWITTTTARRHI